MPETSTATLPASAARPANSRAALYLTGATALWGATFLLMEVGTDSLFAVLPAERQLAGTAYYLLFRFLAAAALTPLCIPRSLRRLDRAAWREGFWLSIPFTLGFLLQVFGLSTADITPSQSAFLTSLYVVVTPMMTSLLERRLPPRGVLYGLPLAILGPAFISGPPTGGLSVGAWATVGCAVAFAGQIVYTDRASRRADPMALTFTMLVFACAWTFGGLLLAPGGAALLAPSVIARTLTQPGFVLTALACSLFATVIAIALLNRYQKEMHPARAALLYTAEPVFAALISVGAGREAAGGWLLVGAAAILAANVLAARTPNPGAAP